MSWRHYPQICTNAPARLGRGPQDREQTIEHEIGPSSIPDAGKDRFGQLRVKAAFGPGCHRRCAALTRSPQAETVRWSFRNAGERSTKQMRTVFIRHGQSTGNAGIPAHDLALLELTELGWRQSREVATGWTETPSLILCSPFLRTSKRRRRRSASFPRCPSRSGLSESSGEPLERHSEFRAHALHRALLGRSRSGLLRRRGRRELQYLAQAGGSGFGAAGSHAGRCSGLRLQPRAVNSGRPNRW